jgi:hypothetical protein
MVCHSAANKAFEPKLNARLIELLDIPKRQEQLLTLIV